MVKHITIGVAGHVDHGKTALVRSLTGIDTDRWHLEKQRGLSIEAGVARLDLPSGHQAALIDVPGHADYMKNALRGLCSVDLAVLVVAADDGVMPQTGAHLNALRLFGAKGGLVVLTKKDLVDAETLELAALDVQETLSTGLLADKPIIAFSAVDRTGVEAVLTALETEIERIPPRPVSGPFRLWIDRLRSVKGFGTVVSGTILSGRIQPDAQVEIWPLRIQARARSLEVHGRKVDQAVAGQRVGINLHKVPLKSLKRGMLLSAPDHAAVTRFVNVELKMLPGVRKPLRNRGKVRLFLGPSMTVGEVVLLDGEAIAPDTGALAQIRSPRPFAALAGDRFVIARLDMTEIIGGGRILEITSEKFRPKKAATLVPILGALAQKDAHGFTRAFAEAQPLTFFKARDLERRTGWPMGAFESAVTTLTRQDILCYAKGKGALSQAACHRVQEQVLTLLARQTIATLGDIAGHLDRCPDREVLAFILDDLCTKGRIRRLDGGYHRPDIEMKTAAVTPGKGVQADILKFATGADIIPFSAHTCWKAFDKKPDLAVIQRHLDQLTRQRRLIRLENRRFLTPEALEKIKGRVARQIDQSGSVTLFDLPDILGIGRTAGAPVLDYLNQIGFTHREGDRHTLIKP